MNDDDDDDKYDDKWPMYILNEQGHLEKTVEYKCRFFNFCHIFRHDGYTCNHKQEASEYCGEHRRLVENIEKGWGP